jgi:putative sterol carrier protein
LLEGPRRAESRGLDFAKLKKLAAPGKGDSAPAFERLAKLLESSAEVADVQIDLTDGRKTDSWTVSLDRKTAVASNGPARRPDVRIIVSRKTWQKIAGGEQSPLDAFVSGELRIRGNTELAERLFKRAAGPGQTGLLEGP